MQSLFFDILFCLILLKNYLDQKLPKTWQKFWEVIYDFLKLKYPMATEFFDLVDFQKSEHYYFILIIILYFDKLSWKCQFIIFGSLNL